MGAWVALRDLELAQDTLVRANSAINASKMLFEKAVKQLEREGSIVDKPNDVLEGVINATRQPTVTLV